MYRKKNMSKELGSMSRSVMSGVGANMCPKHSGFELKYFNAKEGRKQCLMCIMQASSAEGREDKERFCIKHPGYENSFFCYECQKVCCEKCLIHHRKHKIESIALKAANLRDKFDDYRTEFIQSSKQWVNFFGAVKNSRERYDEEIDKTARAIETLFDTTIEKLKKRKLDTVATFKKKANGMIQDFLDRYREYEGDIRDIHKKTEEFNEINQLFNIGDNMELIIKSEELELENLIDNYGPQMQKKFTDHKTAFADIRSKSNYTFNLVNNFNEEELTEFINKQFVVKIAKADKQEDSKSVTEENPQPLSPSQDEESGIAAKSDIALHKIDVSNKILWIFQGQTFSTLPFNVSKSAVKLLKSTTTKGGAIENWGDLRSLRLSSGEIIFCESSEKGTTL